MKISLLIPYKPDNGRRDYLWSLVQERYSRLMPGLELCIGHDDSEIFNRAHAVNDAANKATGDVFIIVDTDIIFGPELIRKIASIIHFHPWIIPFRNGYRLTKEATDKVIAQGMPSKIIIGPRDYERNQNEAGVLMNAMTRKTFEMIGGLDEFFYGYGYEDFAMSISLDTLCGKHHRMDDSIYHLWHQSAPAWQKDNVERWRRYMAASGNVEAVKDLVTERFRINTPIHREPDKLIYIV